MFTLIIIWIQILTAAIIGTAIKLDHERRIVFRGIENRNKYQDTRTKMQEPRCKIQETRYKNQEPRCKKQVSGTKNQEPRLE